MSWKDILKDEEKDIELLIQPKLLTLMKKIDLKLMKGIFVLTVVMN